MACMVTGPTRASEGVRCPPSTRVRMPPGSPLASGLLSLTSWHGRRATRALATMMEFVATVSPRSAGEEPGKLIRGGAAGNEERSCPAGAGSALPLQWPVFASVSCADLLTNSGSIGAEGAGPRGPAVDPKQQAFGVQGVDVPPDCHFRDAEHAGEVRPHGRCRGLGVPGGSGAAAGLQARGFSFPASSAPVVRSAAHQCSVCLVCGISPLWHKTIKNKYFITKDNNRIG